MVSGSNQESDKLEQKRSEINTNIGEPEVFSLVELNTSGSEG